MRSKLATIAIVALGAGSAFGLVACGGGDKTVTSVEEVTPPPPAVTVTPTQTKTETVTTPPVGNCCNGPGGAYAGCSMQYPPNCQN